MSGLECREEALDCR